MAMTGSTDYWSGLQNSLTDIALDWLRYKQLDLERPGDDRNLPDQADLRYGYNTAGQAYGPFVPAPLGITWMQWGVIAAATVGGVVLLKRVL